MAERDTGAVDLTKNGGAAGNLGHQGGFAETHLAKALAEAFIAAQLAHATGQTGGQLAEGVKIGAGVGHVNETEYQDSISKIRWVNLLS